MMNPKIAQPPQAKRSIDPASTPGRLAMMPANAPSQDTIRTRAYQLYESRGRADGQDEQDWIRAEQELLKHA